MNNDTDTDDAALADDAEWREARAGMLWRGLRVDKALVEMAGEFSRNHLQGLIEQGHVWVDGQLARGASQKLQLGQLLRVQLVPTAESLAFKPEAIALDVVFEDDDLMVIHKPSGMVVHPAAGNWSGTLLNALLAHHSRAATLPRAGIVHRLDKDTSGLMVVGKTLEAVTALMRDIAARDVHRAYLAITQGAWPWTETLTIDAPVGRDPQSRIRMAVVGSGKPARTDVAPVAISDRHGLVRCTLHTGRTHQIRVHLAHKGFPLVADSVYGGAAALGLQRQALHATELNFAHPISRVPLAFTQEPPADFAEAWAQVLASAV